MAPRRLPNEIWQTILRYSIALPVFFEVDPIEACGFQEFISWYQDLSVYWKVERHRNILRRVCSGWNAYLQRFNHRFVQLEDVTKGYIPESSVSKAVRLAYSDSSRDILAASRALVRLLLGEENESWSLEILCGGFGELDELIVQSAKTPRLRSIFTRNIEFNTITSFTSTLRLLQGWFEDLPSEPHFELSHLTSLSIIIVDLDSMLLPPCSLPSLKHLSIQLTGKVFLTPENFIQMLETHGRNLITLLDNCPPSDYFFPDEAWSLCPKLQWLQTSFRWSPDSYISPSLRVLQLPLSSALYEPIEISTPTSAFRKAGVKLIVFDGSWTSTIQGSLLGYYMEFTVFFMDRGIFFRDIHGVTFQNFMVTLLHHRKKPYRTLLPYWSRRYCIF